jgi:hypothetical protein
LPTVTALPGAAPRGGFGSDGAPESCAGLLAGAWQVLGRDGRAGGGWCWAGRAARGCSPNRVRGGSTSPGVLPLLRPGFRYMGQGAGAAVGVGGDGSVITAVVPDCGPSILPGPRRRSSPRPLTPSASILCPPSAPAPEGGRNQSAAPWPPASGTSGAAPAGARHRADACAVTRLPRRSGARPVPCHHISLTGAPNVGRCEPLWNVATQRSNGRERHECVPGHRTDLNEHRVVGSRRHHGGENGPHHTA